MQIPSALLAKHAGRILFGILALFILGWLIILFFFLVEPTNQVENVLATNVTDRQASISWTTKKPTRGALIVSENGKFPLLPFFIKNFKKDDSDKGFLRMGFYTTHHVTLDNLKSKTAYEYMIYQGWKKVYRANLLTGPVLNQLPNPNPVYGQVFMADKNPAQGALIYLQAQNGATKSAVLSTITNKEGRWSLDLGNLRTRDFIKGFSLNADTEEIITIQKSLGKRFKATTKFGFDQPWPDVILSGKQ